MWRLAPGPRRQPWYSVRKKTTALVAMAAVTVFALVRGGFDLRTSQRLAAEGLVTPGRITGQHAEPRSGRSAGLNRYLVDVEYQTQAGQLLSGQDEVTAA